MRNVVLVVPLLFMLLGCGLFDSVLLVVGGRGAEATVLL